MYEYETTRERIARLEFPIARSLFSDLADELETMFAVPVERIHPADRPKKGANMAADKFIKLQANRKNRG